MRITLNRAPLFALTFAAGALVGACDLDKPIGELAPYEPCAGKSCGDSCSACDPADPDCVETAVLKACDPKGACVPETPGLCEEPGYSPCAGKEPCDPCTICDPADPDCVETAVLKVCDESLQCVIATADICVEPPGYDPCEGKVCGDPCTVCDPNDDDCVEDAIYKACNSAGKCAPEIPKCEEPPYNPCAGKEACDPCSFCPPDDPDCVEDAALKVCDDSLKCVYLTPNICQDSEDA